MFFTPSTCGWKWRVLEKHLLRNVSVVAYLNVRQRVWRCLGNHDVDVLHRAAEFEVAQVQTTWQRLPRRLGVVTHVLHKTHCIQPFAFNLIQCLLRDSCAHECTQMVNVFLRKATFAMTSFEPVHFAGAFPVQQRRHWLKLASSLCCRVTSDNGRCLHTWRHALTSQWPARCCRLCPSPENGTNFPGLANQVRSV